MEVEDPQMRIKSVVVPVAGLGTRLMPLVKSQPKEMLAVGRKPVVQYVVEELEQAGMERILFVTGRGKKSIEDHFDYDAELNRILSEDPAKRDMLEEFTFERSDVVFMYVRQRALQRGLGDAIRYAEAFVGDQPFVVALGDSIIVGGPGDGIVRRLVRCFEQERPGAVVAFHEVPREHVARYGIARPKSPLAPGEGGDPFEVEDLIEKPSVEETPSALAVAARYVLAPSIFSALAETPAGKHNEIQLTDAIRILLRRGERVLGVRLAPGEERLDIGNFESYFKAFVELAVRDEKYGPGCREYLRPRGG